jgi:hypothetical protein
MSKELFRISSHDCKELELIPKVKDFRRRIAHVFEELLNGDTSFPNLASLSGRRYQVESPFGRMRGVWYEQLGRRSASSW